jgi:hypothetical protein
MTAVADLRPSWSSRQVHPSAWLPRSFSWRKLTPRWRSILPPSVQFRCSSRFSFSGRDLDVPAVLSTHCSDAARWEADSALFVAERRAKVLPLNAPTHQSARLRSHGSDMGKSRAERIREFWAICAHDLSLWVRMRRQIARTRADFAQFSGMSDKREMGQSPREGR